MVAILRRHYYTQAQTDVLVQTDGTHSTATGRQRWQRAHSSSSPPCNIDNTNKYGNYHPTIYLSWWRVASYVTVTVGTPAGVASSGDEEPRARGIAPRNNLIL